MTKTSLLLDWIMLDNSDSLPLYRQLYFKLRTAIVSGQLTAGSVLPSSRTLARELAISRNTVLNAYDQLMAEGYLEASEGSATSVAQLSSIGPEHVSKPADMLDAAAAPSISRRALDWQSSSAPVVDLPVANSFTPGVPAFDEFPTKKWVGLLASQAYRMHAELADNDAHVGGYGPLREALTSYLRSSRMVTCEPDQVFIVSSARAGLDLVCRLVTDPGASCLMEEPGYNCAKNVIRAAGLTISPVSVDAEGMRIDPSEQVDSNARMAFVTPTHQWPMGVSLSATRRQQLLEWAERRNAWIVEDDYDSEFRFNSPPLATLQGLDGGRRVLYIGTFSKVLFPSLRTAYVVVPRALIATFRQAVYYAGQEPPLHIQAALTEFIREGYFFTHIRRMRRIYKHRQANFTDTLVRYLGSEIPVERPPGGMQLTLTLPVECSATEVSRTAAAVGLHVRPISMYALTDAVPNALHLGFAAVPDEQMTAATESLADAILKQV